MEVTDFLGDHPGGELAILTFAGKDATPEFDMIHPPDVIEKSQAQQTACSGEVERRRQYRDRHDVFVWFSRVSPAESSASARSRMSLFLAEALQPLQSRVVSSDRNISEHGNVLT